MTTTSTGASSSSSTTADYYVSLGDSYAAGFQLNSYGVGHPSTNGFPYQVVGLAAAKGYHFTLANFGCSGATTTSIIQTTGCPPGMLGPQGIAYPTTQASAAEAFIHQHIGHVGLITVSIGGNDLSNCTGSRDPATCFVAATSTVKANLATLLGGLRAAAGPKVPIVGTTYPDVLLGEWVVNTDQATATKSVTTFKSLFNPALLAAYQGVQGQFVDVTAATGAYIPLDHTTTLAPYGTIPEAVAKVCELTYYCRFMDTHATTPGYTIIARLVVETLPAK